MVIKSKNKEISTEFLYQMLQNAGIKKIITGSGQPQITRTNINTLNYIKPSYDILCKFNLITDPIVNKKLQVFQENQQLIAVRDWLLPMLMNGQVKVTD